jgi:hypothetical protein
LSLYIIKHHTMNTALDGGERSASSPGPITFREKATSTRWIEGWVDPYSPVAQLAASSL